MTRTATGYALLLGTGLAAVTTAPSAQAYEWGGGSCIGYGCVRDVHDGTYRPARREYREDGYRPRVRVYEERRRVVEPDDDWDDDED